MTTMGNSKGPSMENDAPLLDAVLCKEEFIDDSSPVAYFRPGDTLFSTPKPPRRCSLVKNHEGPHQIIEKSRELPGLSWVITWGKESGEGAQ